MRLTKHHGLGNDFLVLLDPEGRQPIDADIAVAVCDRHRGVGADGLIRVTPGDREPFAMELRNGDGSRAEMSGNGISCLAQAVVRANNGAHGAVRVETDAGVRVVTVVEAIDGRRHLMRVAMGTPRLGDELEEWVGGEILRAVAVDVGNPHVVCQVAAGGDVPDLGRFGQLVDSSTPGGTNVEIVRPGDDGSIRMAVWERGVGLTQACGTGAVAAAKAAHEWGLAPSSVTVHQPGGPARVELGDPTHMTVPVVAVAEVDWLR